MAVVKTHIYNTISSSIEIYGSVETIWDNITNVKLEQFSDPIIFRLLNIPKPLKSEVVSEGTDGIRIAYFNNGKKFIQKILIWKPLQHYSFSFNPEKGFKVLYFFELAQGVFRIPTGAYFLHRNSNSVTIKLITNYSIEKRLAFFIELPARIILKAFQKYLLGSIKKNSE